jgi:hypothetical protein
MIQPHLCIYGYSAQPGITLSLPGRQTTHPALQLSTGKLKISLDKTRLRGIIKEKGQRTHVQSDSRRHC